MNKEITDSFPDVITLCKKFRVEHLEIFGSAITEQFDPLTSDIDFLVTFSPMLPVEHADCYFGLKEALEALFHRHVDLVEISTLRNPYFIKSIENKRSLLYAA